MLVNIHHDSKWEHNRLLVAGVAFLTVIAAMIAFSIAIYQKKFDDVTTVTIKADRAGLQLAKFGDVRVNGALVGQVRSVKQDGKEAAIEVALNPDAAADIPSNVDVEIRPTTLFGQKFIALVTPESPSDDVLADGDVIPADRVETNVELNRILANLFPLLRAVAPEDLNATLNALATALGGRGEQLGETLDKLDVYLNAIDDSLPTLREDMIKLAQVADTYDVAAPDLIDVLGNVTVTSRTVLDKAADLDSFFSDLQGLAVTSTRVLRNNGRNIIRVGEVTEPVLRLLAIYSPEFPCLITGAAKYAPRLAKAFGGNQVKQYLEFGTLQYRHYDERDRPQYGEVGHGPWCSGLPNPPVPIGPISLKDGSNIENEGNQTPPPPTGGRQAAGQRQALVSGTSTGFAGTTGEKAVVNALLAGETGRAADSYGALGSLLYGPVVRGGETP